MNKRILTETIQQLFSSNKRLQFLINLEGMILKQNMVIARTNADKKDSVDEVAAATVTCLLAAIPATVPAIINILKSACPGWLAFALQEPYNNPRWIHGKSRMPM